MIHRSHISSKSAKAQGWSRIPPPAIREETKNLSMEVGVEYMSGSYLTMTSAGSNPYIGATSYTGNSATYYPLQTWASDWFDNSYVAPTITVQTIIQEREVAKEVEKRTLFRVYVVDPRKNGKILMDGKPVIALNENQSMLKAGVAEVAEREGLELEQVDVYVEAIGTFIRPRKETQKVKMVKDDED